MSDTHTVRQAQSLTGTVHVPADKSIAHRSAMLASIADGTSRIVNYPSSADPQSTLACMRALGVPIYAEDDVVVIEGQGLEGLQGASEALDCGNSGTTMRLLAGILAGQPFASTMMGDASLSKRPMGRIATPLQQMGASVTMTEGCPPLRIAGSQLQGITYRLPMASAQVKSCVLLAGLFAAGETTVIESARSRDHTERMLGLDAVEMDGLRYLTVTQGHRIPARLWSVPGDFSAAAFFLVAGSLFPDAHLQLPSVGLNPTRSALLDVLRAMGANITVENERTLGGEPIGDLTVRGAALQGISIGGDLIPNLIDEIPILAVAATRAEGRTEIRDAHELRVKETDRLAAMTTNLRALGAQVEEREDGLTIEGGQTLRSATVKAFHDHRIAMAMGIAGLLASGTTMIHGADIASVSFPDFWSQLAALSVRA